MLAEVTARAEDPEMTPVERADLLAGVAGLPAVIEAMEASVIWGEEALSKIDAGLALLGNVSNGRCLSLSITCFETGRWRLREHLGEPVTRNVEA